MEEAALRLTLAGRREAAAGLKEISGGLEQVEASAGGVADSSASASRGLEQVTARKHVRGLELLANAGKRGFSFLGRATVNSLKAAAVGSAALSLAMGGVSVKAIGLAGDARETASAFDTVFGPAADGIDRKLGRLTDRFGIYNPLLQDATRQFGVFGKAAGVADTKLPGFSTSLTKAGLDLASFYNVSSDDALQAIRSGLSGEAEPLRKFGIFLSDAAMKSQAATMGFSSELTEAQKVMVRHQLILKGMGDAQGDLARTSAGFANQQKAASDRTKTFLTMMGGPLTTAATGAFRGFNEIAKVGISELEKRLPGLERKAGGMSRTFHRWGKQMAVELPGAIDTAGRKWDSFKDKLAGFKAGGLRRDTKQLTGNLEDMAPALAALGDQLPGISDAMAVTNVVTGFLAKHTDALAAAMPYLAAGYVAVKLGQLAGNAITAVSVPMKIADGIATRQLTKAMKELTAVQGANALATGINTGVTGAQTAATTGGTVAQRGLNAAMRANPIGAIITVVMLLVGGFILLYKNSETFRKGVDWLWNKGLKPFGLFIKDVFIGYLRVLANVWLTVGRFGVMAFRLLLTAAFKTFDGILGAAEAGLGWIPGLGDKIKGARGKFDEFGTGVIDKLTKVEQKLKDAQDKVNGLAKDRKGTITINTVYRDSGGADAPGRPRNPDNGPASARPRGGGGVRGPQAPAAPASDVTYIDGRSLSPSTSSDIYIDGKRVTEVVTDHVGAAKARR